MSTRGWRQVTRTESRVGRVAAGLLLLTGLCVSLLVYPASEWLPLWDVGLHFVGGGAVALIASGLVSPQMSWLIAGFFSVTWELFEIGVPGQREVAGANWPAWVVMQDITLDILAAVVGAGFVVYVLLHTESDGNFK